MNFHDGSGNAPTVDWSKLREISRCGGLAATKWLVVIVGCQLSEATQLGNVPRSLSGTLLDVDVGISSDVLLPEVLDSFILETSSEVNGLDFGILRNEAGGGVAVGHLQGVDGLECGLDAGLSEVGGGVQDVTANVGFPHAWSSVNDDMSRRGWAGASKVVCVEFVQLDLLGCVLSTMLFLNFPYFVADVHFRGDV